MRIDLTREGLIEEVKRGIFYIETKDEIEESDLSIFNIEQNTDAPNSITFKEFIELPSFRETIMGLSANIVESQEKFIQDLKDGQAELEGFGRENKERIGNILGIDVDLNSGPYLYFNKETQELRFHKDYSCTPIVLDMERFLELK